MSSWSGCLDGPDIAVAEQFLNHAEVTTTVMTRRSERGRVGAQQMSMVEVIADFWTV
jgi:hypothetical protein